jgi:hypothetical protein
MNPAGSITGRRRIDETRRLESRLVSYVSVPVWPSGDWLPPRYVERATQVNGWFGLALQRFPAQRMPKHKSFGMEKLTLQADFFSAICAPILPVAADGMADRRHVSADLVRAARLQPDAEERGSRKSLQHAEVGDRGAPAVGARRDDGAPDTIPAYRRVDRPALGGRPAVYEREVLAGDLTSAHQAAKGRVRFLRLRHHKQSRGVAIEPVDDPGPLRVRAARRPARQRPGESRTAVTRGRMDHHPRRLVDHQQVLVLEHHLEGHVSAPGCRVLDGRDRNRVARGEPMVLRAGETAYGHYPGLDQPLCGGSRGSGAA